MLNDETCIWEKSYSPLPKRTKGEEECGCSNGSRKRWAVAFCFCHFFFMEASVHPLTVMLCVCKMTPGTLSSSATPARMSWSGEYSGIFLSSSFQLKSDVGLLVPYPRVFFFLHKYFRRGIQWPEDFPRLPVSPVITLKWMWCLCSLSEAFDCS